MSPTYVPLTFLLLLSAVYSQDKKRQVSPSLPNVMLEVDRG